MRKLAGSTDDLPKYEWHSISQGLITIIRENRDRNLASAPYTTQGSLITLQHGYHSVARSCQVVESVISLDTPAVAR